MQKQFEKNALEKSDDTYSLSIRVHTTKTTFGFIFYHNVNDKENVFFRARAEKGIAWHINASSVVETLIYHDKLANRLLD